MQTEETTQPDSSHYIPFLVHSVTAGTVITIKFYRERDFNTRLSIIESHLIIVHDPILCISFIVEWVIQPNISILNKMNMTHRGSKVQ